MDNDKLDIILRAKNGDKSALVELIKQEENNIYSTLYYLKQDDNELSDIMQNVLLKITTKIKTLKNPQYFKTWLNRITLNTYYDFMRKHKRKFESYNINSEIYENIEDNGLNPLGNILEKELNSIITKSIRNLPSHYKIPITLREIQGLSYEDISAITKISIGTVKSRIARARGILKNEIAKYEKS